MKEKTFQTPQGTIHYWVNEINHSRPTLVLLPGLTADHHLFDKQADEFETKYNLLVWDAPGHATSRPFKLAFSLKDKAGWLYSILKQENIEKPVLVGQSMGGYVSQTFLHYFPNEAAGFISIDSSPLKRNYYTKAELWLLKRTKPLYQIYPWKSLVKAGAKGCAETDYGRQLMRDMMQVYDSEKDYYCSLVSHGYQMLAEAVEADFPYHINCPALLLCGEKDQAGSTKSYNKRWAQQDGLPLVWLPNAGHNANTDQPEMVNELIEFFVNKYLRDSETALNENCPCQKIDCPRHGNCIECRAHHSAKGHLTTCQKIAEKNKP